MAEALIRVGVRCVIAAGWAVDDGAAQTFAETFYGQLLNGSRFIDAVAAARVEARARGGNTWAAYQCYGDPDWTYRRATGDAQRPTTPPPSQEFAGVASATSLILQLERLAVESEYQRAARNLQADRLRYLEDTFRDFWRSSGAVAEAFGLAWAKVGDFAQAIGWYERARVARTEARRSRRSSSSRISEARGRGSRRAGHWRNGARRCRTRGVEIATAVALLDTLIGIAPTVERESIYGSAYKRLALIEASAGRHAAEREAIEKMAEHYAKAEKIARASVKDGEAAGNLFYPVMNQIFAQLALGSVRGASGPVADGLARVRQSMAAGQPDFSSVVGQTEMRMYERVVAGTLASDLEGLTKEFRKHHARVDSPSKWGSVYDTAMLVLWGYRRRATSTEARAATEMLTALAALAGQPVVEVAETAAPRARKPARPSRSRKSARRPAPRRRAKS